MKAFNLPSLLTVLLTFGVSAKAVEPITVVEAPDRLLLSQGGEPLGEFLFAHPKLLRPGFANLHAPGGIQVTRTFPPVEGIDATDHADMHPGLWLGFGDISGEDFWRNKGTIRHDSFLEKAAWKDGQLTFATESTLITSGGSALAGMINRFTLRPQDRTLRLEWDAAITPTTDGFYFGDQEEMGLGARIATAITEKNGGLITSSTGLTTAAKTWGQPAKWCDYSGLMDGRRVGVLIIPDPGNPQPSWWHNRDYGFFAANAFGRKAMTQGETSRIEVKRGETYRIKYAVILYALEKGDKIDLKRLAE